MKYHCLYIYIVTITLFFEVNPLSAQSPEWMWAKSTDGNYYEDGEDIATDGHGNIYVSGTYFSDSIIFGNFEFGNAGYNEIYIVKYNPDGKVVWAHTAGGSSDDINESITTDNSGNIYVAGYFRSPEISFGSITLHNYSPGSDDLFIAKYDTDGNILWAKSAGGSGAERVAKMTTDSKGNLYITGNFSSSPMSFGTFTLESQGENDIFISKLDSNGNIVWAISEGGDKFDAGRSIAIDSLGYIYITGLFQSIFLNFGDLTLQSNGESDIFTVKYDNNGKIQWVHSIGTEGIDVSRDIAVDSMGNIYITGFFFSSTLSIGPISLLNNGESDIFIVKYSSDGDVMWGHSAGGSSLDMGSGIITDTVGNVYLTGFFGRRSIAFGNVTLQSASEDNMFIIKYDRDGNALWAKTADGGQSEEANSIAFDNFGNIIVAGSFNSETFTIGSKHLKNSSYPYTNMFVAKLKVPISTSIVKDNRENNINLVAYPSPVFDKLSLEYSVRKAALVTINIIDMKGNILRTPYSEFTTKGNYKLLISTQDLISGLYFIELVEDGIKKNCKVIIAD